MAKGNCECCKAKDVTIYRKRGVNRCYHCDKSGALPIELPKAEEQTQEAAPVEAVVPVSDEVAEEFFDGVDLSAGEVPDTLSWDDFEPLDLGPLPGNSQCRIAFGKVCFTTWATALGKLVRGEFVEFRRMPGGNLAVGHVEEGKTARKVTFDGTHRSTISMIKHCAAWKVKEGNYEVEAAPWGLVIRLDRPVEAKA